jgi:hypothetical protein
LIGAEDHPTTGNVSRVKFTLSLLATLVTLQAGAQDYAPLETQNQRAYNLIFLRFIPDGPLLINKEERWNLSFSGSNDYFLVPNTLINPVLKEKIEMDRLTLHYERGIGKRFQIGALLPAEDLGGGFMDSIIRWYHHTIVNLHDIRDSFPNGTHVLLSPSGGPFAGGFGLGDLELFAHYGLGSSSLVGVGLKLPTGNTVEVLGSGAADIGVSAQTDFPIAPHFRALLQGGLIAQGKASVLTGTRSLAWQQTLSVIWARNSQDSWIAQFGRESSGLNMGVPLSDQTQATASLAYRRRLSTRTSLTAYFSENVDLLNPNLPNGTN